MKRILLPTDFSENAFNAIVYAVQLFKDEKCTFFLLNTYTPAAYHTGMMADSYSALQLENITRHTEPSLAYLHSLSKRLWGLGKFLRKIGLRNDINHGNHFASIRQYEALKNDLWYYGLL